ncbi:putative ribonuclease H-like domain-containing protein [Tanacetum coccineum]
MVKPVWNNDQRVNDQNFAKKTHPCAKKNIVPRAVLMKSGLVSVNTARQDQGVIDSGCSRHMTGNMSYLTNYEEIDGGYVAFGGNPKGRKIIRKGTIKTGNPDFENVYFVRELKFNLFSVSQICDKNNSVLFNDTECIVLSPNFKLIDESQVLHRVPRKNNMYSVDLKNIVLKGGLTCLFAKATSDESKLWHRRLGHLNFKTMNKLVKENLVRGLPSKLFENDQTCVACQKGKQHRASCNLHYLRGNLHCFHLLLGRVGKSLYCVGLQWHPIHLSSSTASKAEGTACSELDFDDACFVYYHFDGAGSDVLTVMTKFRECPFLVTVLATLGSDASICKRALKLMYLLINETNVEPLTKGLIDYLEISDQDFKGDLTAKICSIVEKLSLDKLWYIDQMLKVLCEVTENDAVDVIELAINRHTSDLTTRSMCLIALLKLSSRFPSCSHAASSLLILLLGLREINAANIYVNTVEIPRSAVKGSMVMVIVDSGVG